MFGKSAVDVLVVGAGPVGLFTALRLVRRGLKVRIIDRASHVNSESYALALHPSSLKFLEEAGIAPALFRKGRRIERVTYFENDQPVAALSYAELDAPHPCMLIVPQSELERHLAGALMEMKTVVEWGSELIELKQGKHAFEARTAKLAEYAQGYAVSDLARMRTHEETIQARFIVGADGMLSGVRRIMEGKMEGLRAARHYAIFEVEAPWSSENEVRYYWSGAGAAVLWPMAEGRVRWTFELDGEESCGTSLEDLQDLLIERAPDYPKEGLHLRWSTHVRFRQSLSDKLASPGIWLAGDAAHQTGPMAVHGMNFGLMEATLIESQIAAIEKGGMDAAAAASAYQQRITAEWVNLVDEKVPVAELVGVDPWVIDNLSQLMESVPAIGDHRRELLMQVRSIHATS